MHANQVQTSFKTGMKGMLDIDFKWSHDWVLLKPRHMRHWQDGQSLYFHQINLQHIKSPKQPLPKYSECMQTHTHTDTQCVCACMRTPAASSVLGLWGYSHRQSGALARPANASHPRYILQGILESRRLKTWLPVRHQAKLINDWTPFLLWVYVLKMQKLFLQRHSSEHPAIF